MPNLLLATPEQAAGHDHSRGYPMRAFVGRTGVWVQRHGEWSRPLHVWLYRGAWRILCFACMTSLQSDDELYSQGWRTQRVAFDVAHAHCRACTVGKEAADAS